MHTVFNDIGGFILRPLKCFLKCDCLLSKLEKVLVILTVSVATYLYIFTNLLPFDNAPECRSSMDAWKRIQMSVMKIILNIILIYIGRSLHFLLAREIGMSQNPIGCWQALPIHYWTIERNAWICAFKSSGTHTMHLWNLCFVHIANSLLESNRKVWWTTCQIFPFYRRVKNSSGDDQFHEHMKPVFSDKTLTK